MMARMVRFALLVLMAFAPAVFIYGMVQPARIQLPPFGRPRRNAGSASSPASLILPAALKLRPRAGDGETSGRAGLFQPASRAHQRFARFKDPLPPLPTRAARHTPRKPVAMGGCVPSLPAWRRPELWGEFKRVSPKRPTNHTVAAQSIRPYLTNSPPAREDRQAAIAEGSAKLTLLLALHGLLTAVANKPAV